MFWTFLSGFLCVVAFPPFLFFWTVHDQIIKVPSHINFFTFKRVQMIEKILGKSRIVLVRCINVKTLLSIFMSIIINLPSWSEYCLIISNWKLLLNSIETPTLILTEHYFLMACIVIDGRKRCVLVKHYALPKQVSSPTKQSDCSRKLFTIIITKGLSVG